MGSFDHGYAGMISLRSVNQWIGVINSNLGGTNRTAYKATKVSFGGGVSQLLRDPRQEVNGIQLPASTLTVDHTRIDFSQGTVIQDGELTHFAISGDGFFRLHDPSQGIALGVGGQWTTEYYTRDGAFRWTLNDTYNAAVGLPLGSIVLVHEQTGFVVRGRGTGFGEIVRVGSGATFSATISSVSGVHALSGPPAVVRFTNNQALKFSKYGSTIFQIDRPVPPFAFVDPSFVTDVELFQSALEASNAALNDTLPELALAQKLFSAVSKIINVHNSDLDITVNLIR